MKNVNLTIYFNRVRGNMFFNKKHTIVGIQLRNDDVDKYFINIENGTIKLEEPFTNPSKLPYQHHMYKDGINDTDCLLFLEWLEGLNGKEINKVEFTIRLLNILNITKSYNLSKDITETDLFLALF